MKQLLRAAGLTLALLLVTVVLAPHSATLAKYVQAYTVGDFNLTISAPAAQAPIVEFALEHLTGQSIGLFSNSADCRIALQPDEGYALPDVVSVSIDGSETVVDAGQSHDWGLVYDQGSGMLFIPGSLLTGAPSHILVEASAILQPSIVPSLSPSLQPSLTPSVVPSVEPSFEPSTEPIPEPSITPSVTPSTTPTLPPEMTFTPSAQNTPTPAPSMEIQPTEAVESTPENESSPLADSEPTPEAPELPALTPVLSGDQEGQA